MTHCVLICYEEIEDGRYAYFFQFYFSIFTPMSEGTNSKFSSRSYTQSKYGDESQNTFEPTKEKDREVGKDDIEEKQKLLKQIQTSIIGENEAIHTINGYRKLTYADYTASGTFTLSHLILMRN